MASYIAFGIEAKHLLTAVIMTAPGTLLMAKMLVPETEKPLTGGRVEMPPMEKEANFLGALARGTTDGLHLGINVGAMLISFLAMLALANALMGGAHNWLAAHGIAWFPSSLQQIFGWVFAPVAWLIGIPWHDAASVGNLLGTRMVVNELVAFQQLGTMHGSLDARSFTIATFALCGFANFSSIGIQIGGIGALAPEQRRQLAKFGVRAMLAGTMAISCPRPSWACCFERQTGHIAVIAKPKANSEFSRAERAAKFILSKTKRRPEIALVLGSGLGAFADEFARAVKIPYAKIPNF